MYIKLAGYVSLCVPALDIMLLSIFLKHIMNFHMDIEIILN